MKYYLKKYREGPEDAIEFQPRHPIPACGKYAAEHCIDDIAEEIYFEGDGWEYMPNETIDVVVIDDDETEYLFEITTEFSPDFYCEYKGKEEE